MGARAHMEGLLKEEARTVSQLPRREQGVKDSRGGGFSRCGSRRSLHTQGGGEAGVQHEEEKAVGSLSTKRS